VTELLNTEEQLKRDFELFRRECIELRNLYNVIQCLYLPASGNQQTLRNAAELFFSDLRTWLTHLYFVYVGRIMDNEKGMGRKNLSATALVKNLQSIKKSNVTIEKLLTQLEEYSALLKDARNRLVAHLDLDTIRSGTTLGATTEGELSTFFDNLQHFTDEFGNAIGVGALDYSVQAGKGDVIDLLKILKLGSSNKEIM